MEVTNGSRSSVTGRKTGLEERLDSLSLQKGAASSEIPDKNSHTASEDVVMEEAPHVNTHVVEGSEVKGVRSMKSVPATEDDESEDVGRFKCCYKAACKGLEQLVEQRNDEQDVTKRQALRMEIQDAREDIQFYEERVVKWISATGVSGRKANVAGSMSGLDRKPESVIPLKAIPYCRVYIDHTFNSFSANRQCQIFVVVIPHIYSGHTLIY
jgi:hypothetical protein